MPETERRTSDSDRSVDADSDFGELTDDAFLGGQLQILQPKRGYRAGIDAVLLAASVAAKSGQAILELGAGVGVASLCLARRVAGAQLTGVEIQSELATIAATNIKRNELYDHVDVVEGNFEKLPAFINQRNFDHVMLNPPYFENSSAMGAPNRSKHISKFGTGPAIEDWIATGLRRVKPGGCITVIYPAELIDRVIVALGLKAGMVRIFPLWPKRQSAASRVIVAAVKGSAAPVCLLPGLVLHADDGSYTSEANAVLREGRACSWDGA